MSIFEKTDMGKLYSWFQENDIPNWIILFFSGILWPIFLYWFSRRKKTGIPDLKVALVRSRININGNLSIPALQFRLSNRTNSKIFLTNIKIRENRKNFKLYRGSSTDISTGFFEMLFMDYHAQNADNTFNYTLNDLILQTNEIAQTAIGLEQELSSEVIAHRPFFFRRLFNCPKYFTLEYTALVGNKKYSVKTNY